MKYQLYAVNGSEIAVSEAEVLEIVCDKCGASWLHEHLSGPLAGCPYCGDDALDFGVTIVAEQSGREAQYARDVRGIARALWNGTVDLDQAFSLMLDTVGIGLTRAWHEGAAECGIAASELSPQETLALQDAIVGERQHILPFLTDVQAGSKVNGGKFAPFLRRAEMWGLRYTDVANRARLMACGDQKLVWRLDVIRIAKEHCGSCLKLAGKIKRASYWDASGIRPQSPALACGGWLCACGFGMTTGPLSNGPLPSIP